MTQNIENESLPNEKEEISFALYETAQHVKRGQPLNNKIIEDIVDKYEMVGFEDLKQKAKELNKILRTGGTFPDSEKTKIIIQDLLNEGEETEQEQEQEQEQEEEVLENEIEKDNTEMLRKSLVEVGNIILSERHLTNFDIKEIASRNGLDVEELKGKAMELNRLVLSQNVKKVEVAVQEVLDLKKDSESNGLLNDDEERYKIALEEVKGSYMKNPVSITKDFIMKYGFGARFLSEVKESLPEWSRERRETEVVFD